MNLFFYFFKVALTLALACLFFFFLLPVITAGGNFGSVSRRTCVGNGRLFVVISGGLTAGASAVGVVAGICFVNG